MKAAVAALAAALTLAAPATAGAAPTRVTCERLAKQEADRSGARPGSAIWRIIYAGAFGDCMRGLPVGRASFRVTPIPWWLA